MGIGSRPSLTRVLSLAILWFACAWRAWGLTAQSLWRDEVDALRFATRPWPETLAMFTRPGENGPLYFLLLRPWLALAGHSEYALRFPALAAGVVAVALTMALTRRLRLPRDSAAAVGLLLATNPYLTWYSQDAKMYALLTALAVASSLAFARALAQGGLRRWGLYWALTTACVYIHVLGALLIPLHALWFLVSWPRARRRWVEYTAALAGLTLPYLPIVWWQFAILRSGTFNPGFPFLPLDEMTAVLVLAFSRGLAPIPGPWAAAPAVFLVLCGLWLEAASRAGWDPPRARIWLALWLIFPTVALFAICLRAPLFTDRYLIWIAPALWLLAARGATILYHARRGLALALVGVVLALNVQATAFQTYQPIKSDFRQAAALVERARRPDDAIILLMPYIHHTYRYYARRDFPQIEPPYTNAGGSPEQVADEMARSLQGWSGVWLVSSEPEFWDARGLVRAWLDAHAEHVLHAAFARVDVDYYRLQ